MRILSIALLIGCLFLSGCAGLGLTNDFASTNAAIAQANADKYRAYSDAMIACGGNAACQVGISLALATGAGDQKMIQPERTSEVLASFVPFASLGLQALGIFYGGVGGTGSSGFVVTGDNNSFSGIGNNMEASGGSSVEAPYSMTNSFSWSTNNRDYSLGNDAGMVNDTGIVDPVESTVTDDPVIPVIQ